MKINTISINEPTEEEVEMIIGYVQKAWRGNSCDSGYVGNYIPFASDLPCPNTNESNGLGYVCKMNIKEERKNWGIRVLHKAPSGNIKTNVA